ncbi:response regulator [Vibrio intestinalis]|uniref:response regulator n=1 Tax=Vibrio intestinalis TaxID=2933291 RepID=UPI0021A45077|nr:response regulator [Vibrio intestinalis]
MIESFLHPIFLLLSAVCLVVLGWAIYFLHSIKISRGIYEKTISIPYVCYTFSILAWVLSNAFFYSPLLVEVNESLILNMALFANLASYCAFSFAFLVTNKLIRDIDKPVPQAIQSVVFITLTILALYWNSDVGPTVIGVTIQSIGNFHLHLGEQAIWFFLSIVALLGMSLRNVLLYSRKARPLQHIKSLYMLFGIGVFMVSTIVVNGIVPLIWQNFSLTWLPPTLSITEMLLMGYALLTSRFYSNRHILYSVLSVLFTSIAIAVPLSLVINSVSTFDFSAIIFASCLISGLAWRKLLRKTGKYTSRLVYGNTKAPHQTIRALSNEFQRSTSAAISKIADTLDISEHDLQLISNLNDEKVYTSQLFNQNSVLIFEEIEEIVLTESNSNPVLEHLYQKMKDENVALVLPIFDYQDNMTHLLLARKKRNGHLYYCEEVLALQKVLKTAQGYINADRKVRQSQALANSIAHEMRNPLAQVQLQFESVSQKIQQGASSDELELEVAKGKMAIERGRQLIDIILREVNDAALEQEPSVETSMKQSIHQAIERYAFSSNEIRQRVSLVTVHDFRAKINDTLFSFVIFNLLRNAIYYFDSYPDSKIEIRTMAGKYENYVIFRDTGPGIPEKLINRVFDDFFSHNKSGGSGLGLGYCKRVMKSFGGSIQCYSKEGEFTEFHLTFPVGTLSTSHRHNIEEASPTLTPSIASTEPHAERIYHTILVVDDKEVQRELVKLYLNQLGYDVILANNGKVAVEIIQNNAIDLVFMDIQMPIMNGFEAARIIREDYPQIPIYALSGESGEPEVAKIKQLMDGRLVKPTTKLALKETLQKALDSTPA